MASPVTLPAGREDLAYALCFVVCDCKVVFLVYDTIMLLRETIELALALALALAEPFRLPPDEREVTRRGEWAWPEDHALVLTGVRRCGKSTFTDSRSGRPTDRRWLRDQGHSGMVIT